MAYALPHILYLRLVSVYSSFPVLLFKSHCCVLSHLVCFEVPSHVQLHLKISYLRLAVASVYPTRRYGHAQVHLHM